MSTLSDVSQSNIGWVYPPQPQTIVTTVEEVIGLISGITALIEGQDYVDVVFGSAQPDAGWILIEASVFNVVDTTPINVWNGVVTGKTVNGFRLQLNGVPDSGNYYLGWSIRGVFGYYLSGPTSGRINVASTTFTVRLPDDTSLSGTVVITPSDGGAGGSFTPSTVSLTEDAPSKTFTYTPSSYGSRSISTSNDRGLVDAPQIGYISTASTYTFSGPSSGAVGAASTNFTAALPVGGAVSGTVVVTPSDGGAGGTFIPSTVSLTTASPSATFTYTPISMGVKTLSVTNNGGLTNPSSLGYTVTAAFVDTFTGGGDVLVNAHTSDTGHTWGPEIYNLFTPISKVSAGSLYGSSLGGDDFASSYTPPSADQDASITIIKGSISGSPEVGIWLRVTPGDNTGRGYLGRWVEGTGYRFHRLDTGTSFVQLGSNISGTLGNGDVLKFTVSGTGATVTLTLYKNGVSIGTVDDTSGSRITANGKVGLHMYDPSDGTGNYRVNKIES